MKQVQPRKNRYSDVAGLFFFSLLNKFDAKGCVWVVTFGKKSKYVYEFLLTQLQHIQRCSSLRNDVNASPHSVHYDAFHANVLFVQLHRSQKDCTKYV